jgi:hypothetical protein
MYDVEREELRISGNYEPLGATCIFDRVVLASKGTDWQKIAHIPGFRATRRYQLWHRQHRRVQRFRGAGTVREVVVEFERSAPWFPEVRITIIPNDATGLGFDDLRSILELLPGFELRILEVAWDFSPNCVVDLDFIRQFGLFGSTWMRPGVNPYHDKWGNAGSKIVRAYYKWEISRFRLELQLHLGFLSGNKITDIFDFRRLVDVLLPHHVDFAEIDETKLFRALRRSKVAKNDPVAFLKRARSLAERSLWSTLRFLSEKARLTNRLRLLEPLPEMNDVVRRSLERLVAQWPQRRQPLRRTP